MIRILRKGDRLEASDYNQKTPELVDLNPQLILSLTHDWKPSGMPVEWGVEPVLEMLRSMDSWTDPSMFTRMIARRERMESDAERAKRNEIRARAADMRRDFARSTNDINTSGLPGKKVG